MSSPSQMAFNVSDDAFDEERLLEEQSQQLQKNRTPSRLIVMISMFHHPLVVTSLNRFLSLADMESIPINSSNINNHRYLS
eukprot:gene15618-18558_t